MFYKKTKVENLNRSQFKELLELSFLNSYFIFDCEFYLPFLQTFQFMKQLIQINSLNVILFNLLLLKDY